MRLMLDTHTLLWFLAGSAELSKRAIKEIENVHNEKFISIASLWEVSIKQSLGKLSVNGDYAKIIDDVAMNGIEVLPITFIHTVQQNRLVWHHRDPIR